MLAEWQTGITKLPVTAAAMTSISEDVKEMASGPTHPRSVPRKVKFCTTLRA